MVWYRFDRRDGVASSWLTRWRGAELPDTMTLYRIARRNDMVPGCSMRLILNATLFVINLFVVNEMRTTCCVCVCNVTVCVFGVTDAGCSDVTLFIINLFVTN